MSPMFFEIAYVLILLFNLLGIIAFLIWKQYLNKTNDSGSCGNV